MKLLFIGDIVARPGREILRRGLKALVRAHGVDVVIANVENAAGGAGVTREIANDVLDAGVHALTSGNHIWDKREALEFIGHEPRLIRPANFPEDVPGRGSFVFQAAGGVGVGVINIMGRIFMTPLDNPFATVAREIARVRGLGARIILVDFHAEATSEKIAMAWHLDGQVTSLIGTHTHVQTADARVLPGGTAYITDVGMTGAHDGVIGMEKTAVISRFLTGVPVRLDTAAGDARLHAVVVTADTTTGLATGIDRVSITSDEIDALRASANAIEPVETLS